MLRPHILSGLALLLAVSCSAPDPYSGKAYDDARQSPVLPYAVKINEIHFVDALMEEGASGDVTIQGVQPARIADADNELKIRTKVLEALNRFQVFAVVAHEDSEFEALGLKPELELDVFIEARQNVREYHHDATGMKWANLFLWLFAGVPGWIIEDTNVDAGVEAIACAIRTPAYAEGEVFRRDLDLSDANSVNFMRRAGWPQYFYQLIVPPFLVSSDREAVDEALYENYVSRMQSHISRDIKESLARELVGKIPQLVVVSPVEIRGKVQSTGSDIDVVVFSSEEPDSIEVAYISGKDEPKKLLSSELKRVDRSRWEEKVQDVLGSDIGYLSSYSNVFVISEGGKDALDDVSPGENTFLRFTVTFGGRRATTQTWTVPY